MNRVKQEIIDEDIFVLHDVLTVQECEDLITQSEEIGYHEATVNTGSSHRVIKGVRNNLRVIVDDDHFASNVWSRVKKYFEEEIHGFKSYGLNERFRFYKYNEGHRFKMHKDGAFLRDTGDTSIYTFIIYLNDNYEGGTTDFKKGHSVQPKTGSALVFLHPELHEGCLVESGIKYAIRSDVMYLKK